MEHELDLLDHLNDTVTRITEDTLLLSLLLDYTPMKPSTSASLVKASNAGR